LLLAGAGNDTLDGGTGADTLDGGAGDDTYVVDHVGDGVVEAADGGVDLVRSSVSHTLASNVEQLILTGSAANGTGNGLDNLITGNGAANVLAGGAGADTLAGGAGNDTLQGGDGNDQLEGGTGADWMDGGAGDDTYLVDNAGDVVVEATGGGTDTEISTVTRTLAAGVENLVLGGEAGINGTGNELNNVITGNTAANILTGGAGSDTLVGGGGADVLRGGDGDDLMIAGDLASVSFALGGAGFDTLQLSVPGSTLDLDGLIGRASGIEALDLRNGAAGSVDFSTLGLTSITDSGSLVLRLDKGDTIAIQGGGTLVQTAANDNSITYSVYSSADLTQQQVGNLQVVWGP
jgi:Ca2+-binding RTX toxin-like protein